MSALKNLAFHNPGILSDEDFLAGFVARQKHAQRLLARLKEIALDGLATHHLILGQRGMGKTSMLRRLAFGVREDPDLASRFIPLSFREEQYNVNSLRVLWLNCLDALGDWYEKHGQTDKASELDRKIAILSDDNPQKDSDGQAALDLFHSLCKAEGKRPLLLLDNVDLILNGLGKEQDWSFRRELQKPGGIAVVGAAVAYLESSTDPKAAFYDFFQVTVLSPLSREELFSCLNHLAEQRGDAGKRVQQLLAQDAARICALYDLTGGNPRTLTLLYALLELDHEDDVMGDLERLLDQVTVLYKARVEDQSPQARVVLDALALHWNPATAAELGKATGLETNAVSAQLDRLQKNGIIEKVSVSTTVRAAYQLCERFFNIWYLMRHAPRRTRNRLRWLTEFLRSLYTPPQLETHARNLLERPPCNGDYLLALSDAVADESLRHTLCRQGCKALGMKEEEWPDMTAGEMRESGAQYGVALSDALDKALQYQKQGNFIEAENAYRKAIEIDPKMAWLWNNLGNLLQDYGRDSKEAEDAYRKAIELAPENAYPIGNLAYLLLRQPQREETESVYNQALAKLPAPGAALLRAYRALAFDNFGEAVQALGDALGSNSPELVSNYYDDLLRVLQFIKTKHYGDRLLQWFDDNGYRDRFWPVYAAFDAYLHGEERLKDINPEVRTAAKRIYDGLARLGNARNRVTS